MGLFPPITQDIKIVSIVLEYSKHCKCSSLLTTVQIKVVDAQPQEVLSLVRSDFILNFPSNYNRKNSAWYRGVY